MLGTTSFYIIDIGTIPSSLGTILATGYSPLTVTATIEDYPFECRWEYGPNFQNSIIFFHHFIIGCESQTSNTQADITCVREDNKITSNLTLLQPLSKGTLNIRVNCEGFREALPTITVQGNTEHYKFINNVILLIY